MVDRRQPVKAEFQRRYSDRWAFGGNRLAALERDGYSCVGCGMTNDQHQEIWGCTITIDHIDGNGRGSTSPNSELSNLQTLCLRCHGAKDGLRRENYERPDMRGEKHHCAKLTTDDVVNIRRERRTGATYVDLAAKYGVWVGVVYRASIGKTWKVVDDIEPPVAGDHLGNTYRGEGHKDAKMTWASVRALRADRAAGATYKALAGKYGISRSGVANICTYKVWRE